LPDKKLRQLFTTRPKEDKGKVRAAMENNSLKGESTLLYVMRQMREEMDLTWKDFFEKNPGEKEEDVWRRIEERFRSNQNSEDQDKEIFFTAQNA
jgi:hypothetical protein